MATETRFVEASATMRHYSNLQFAIQTLFLAGVGALGSAAFLSDKAKQVVGGRPVGFWAALAALVMSVTFQMLTLSCERHRKHFGNKSLSLEAMLASHEVPGVPPSRLIGATVTLNMFYVLNLMLWGFVACALW